MELFNKKKLGNKQLINLKYIDKYNHDVLNLCQ